MARMSYVACSESQAEKWKKQSVNQGCWPPGPAPSLGYALCLPLRLPCASVPGKGSEGEPGDQMRKGKDKRTILFLSCFIRMKF
jgi:hypothetical protein